MDWERWRGEMEATPGRIHFNHAGVSPVSRRVVDVVTRFIRDTAELEPARMKEWMSRADRVRDGFARLIGARRDEIAFVKNTSEGLSLVAAGLDWRAGDNVIAIDGEYPSNVYPWWGLRRFGVETRMASPVDGLVTVDAVRALADERTRVLSVSFVDWNGGARQDLAALGDWCRSRGVLFCVDAIQGVGALRLDVEAARIDCLAAGGHKWLLAPEGCGCLYVSNRVVDRFESVLLGWKSVADADRYLPYHFEPLPGAAKFEPGTMAFLGILALGAAIDLLHEIGPAPVEARVLGLTEYLGEELRRAGATVTSPWGEGQRSGIVVFRRGDPQRLYAHLSARGFVVRPRGGGIRVAPHFHNTEAQIDELVAEVGGGHGG